MDIFFFLGGGGYYEIGPFGGSFLYILGLFKVKIQNGNIFWAAKFQTFLGMPDFFFGGCKQKVLGSSLCMKKN